MKKEKVEKNESKRKSHQPSKASLPYVSFLIDVSRVLAMS